MKRIRLTLILAFGLAGGTALASMQDGTATGVANGIPMSVHYNFDYNYTLGRVVGTFSVLSGFDANWYGGNFVGQANIGFHPNGPSASVAYLQTSTLSMARAAGESMSVTMTAVHAGTGQTGNYTPGLFNISVVPVLNWFVGNAARPALRITDMSRLEGRGGAIQLATGAESASRPLFSFSGARNWGFEIHYNSILASGQPTQSALGFGWTHGYESSIEVSGSNLILHRDAGSENLFTPLSGSSGVFTSAEDGARYETLTAQGGGGWVLLMRDQSSRSFDSAGKLVEDRDPQGRKVQLSYSSGRISQIADPVSGTSLAFAYDGSGTISGLTDASNASISFGYSAGSPRMLTSITNQNGKTVTFAYNSAKGLTTVTDHNSTVLTTNTYDSNGKVTSQATPGRTEGFALSQTTPSSPLIGMLINGEPFYPVPAGFTGFVLTAEHTDRNGKEATYTFDSNFNRTALVDQLGKVSTYSYDASNRMTSMTDPLNRTSSWTYDARGNVLTATDAGSKVTTFTYDTRNNMLTATDPLSHVTTQTFDSNNNLLTRVDALGRTTTWTYNSNSLPLTMTLPGGGVYQYTYTAGRLTEVSDPNSVVTKFGYDANGRLLYREDALGERVTFTYDAIGNVLTVTNALSQTTTYTYDYRNRVSTMTDPIGSVTSYTYDANHNLLTATNDLGKITTYTYDGEDRLKTVTDALSRVTTYNYDDAGHLLSVVAPGSRTTSFEYDDAGQLIATTDPLGHRSEVNYNTRGLVTSLEDPLSRTTSFAYDDAGRRTSATDPLSRSSTLAYDALNRLTQVTDPGSLVSAQGFDLDGNRTSLTNPAAKATGFDFDDGGRFTATTTPEGHETSVTYNSRGLLASVIEPSNQSKTFSYDDSQRLSSTTDAVGTVAITRDAEGRVLTVTEGSKTLTRAYDDVGRLTSYTDDDGNVLGYQYDDIGRLTQLTYPDSKHVNYVYDTAGRLSTVTDWASRVTTYSYDAADRLTEILRPNGTKQTRSYDNANQLLTIRDVAPNGTTVLYAGDYSYDDAGQLTSEVLAPAPVPAVGSISQTFDDDNRLLTHNGAAVTFDADGNLVSIASGASAGTFSYDARNRLTSAGGLTYIYDSENRRVAITNGSATTRFAINPNAPLDQVLVRTAPNGTKTFYVYGLGLLQEETGSTVRYYHADRRGDTIILTDSSGAVTDRATYGIYGELLSRTGSTSTPFLFNGLYGVQTDSNGLYYHRARYFHPALRRFLNQDSVLGSISNGASMNRFAYANGNPISLVDPFGLAATDLTGAQGSFAALIEATYLQVGSDSLEGILAIWRQVDDRLVQPIVQPVNQAFELGLQGAGELSDFVLPGSGEATKNTLVVISMVTGAGEERLIAKSLAAKTAATPEQLANLVRFEKKLPANATPTNVFDLPNGGKAFQANSASRDIPGSFAQYEKQVDSAGKTLQYTKTTFGPNGEVIHVKDKIGGGVFP